jgi:hypothetical protein
VCASFTIAHKTPVRTGFSLSSFFLKLEYLFVSLKNGEKHIHEYFFYLFVHTHLKREKKCFPSANETQAASFLFFLFCLLFRLLLWPANRNVSASPEVNILLGAGNHYGNNGTGKKCN